MPTLARDQIRGVLKKRIEAFLKGYRQNVGVVGARRLGKTQILSEVYGQLTAHDELIPVYLACEVFDFDQFAELWMGSLLTGAILQRRDIPPHDFQTLLQSAQAFLPRTVEKMRRLKRTMRKEKNAAVVRDLFSLTGTLSDETQKKIVLILDEFHGLSKLPAHDPFSLLGKEIMVQKDTLYISVSSRPEKARKIFRDQLTLLFGNFEVLEIGPLSFSEAAVFLAQKLPGLEFSASQKKFLMMMTDGEPLYLDLLTDRLRTWLPGSCALVEDEFVFRAFASELADENGRLPLWFEKRIAESCRGAKDDFPVVQTLLALSDGRHRLSGIAAYIGLKAEETQKILNRLAQDYVIRRNGSFFLLQDFLFEFWLREVFKLKYHRYRPDIAKGFEAQIGAAIERLYRDYLREETMDFSARVERLFKEFRNDLVEIEEKKIRCPQFSEIVFRPTNGRFFPLYAKGPKTRWLCQIASDYVREEDISLFLDECRKFRKPVPRKIMVAFGGIDQNARLMAHEAKVQLWETDDLNAILSLYDLPKIVQGEREVARETNMGSLEEGVHHL